MDYCAQEHPLKQQHEPTSPICHHGDDVSRRHLLYMGCAPVASGAVEDALSFRAAHYARWRTRRGKHYFGCWSDDGWCCHGDVQRSSEREHSGIVGRFQGQSHDYDELRGGTSRAHAHGGARWSAAHSHHGPCDWEGGLVGDARCLGQTDHRAMRQRRIMRSRALGLRRESSNGSNGSNGSFGIANIKPHGSTMPHEARRGN